MVAGGYTLGADIAPLHARTLRAVPLTCWPGLSLKEIGNHLGHQSPEATRIYAKVDLAAMRMRRRFALEGLL